MKHVAIILVLFLMVGLTPTFQNVQVEATTNTVEESLMLTYTPSVLTAGVVSELVDPSTPFTLYVSDQDGNPVDLTDNGKVEVKNVWDNLFVDPHPKELPQYYWTRLDLHNDDGTDICNETLFPEIEPPISVDFSRASEGVYVFNGFCTNDKGEFDIIVYTPDRKHYGRATIKVESPKIDYAIWNTEDPELRVFHTPGDPDFIMTAADNRLYGVIPTVTTADGRLIRGIAQEVSTCNNYTDARLTVSSTVLANFYFNKPGEVLARDPISGKNIKYISSMGNRYWINLGVDWDRDGVIEQNNKEIYDIADFRVHFNNGDRWTDSNYYTFYNTTCNRWDDGTFTTGYLFEYENTEVGWGMGCIYNSPYLGCYLMPDFNDDDILNYKDSLSLDEKGQTEFYIFANDVCGITCFVGVNHYGNADLAGGGPVHEEDPKDVRRRYKPDGTYKIDMDAFVEFALTSGTTTIKRIDARISMDPKKPEVGQETNCRVLVTRIDDNKPVMNARVQLSGAGVLMTQKTDENGIADFTFTPTESSWIRVDINGGSENGTITTEFRVGKDKTPPSLTLSENIPTLTNENFIVIDGKTEPGASVFINNEEAVVSETGLFTFKFELGEGENTIRIKAVDPSINTTRKSLTITLDTMAPYLSIERVDNRYIEATQIKVTGRVDENSTIEIEGIEGVEPVTTSSTFEFSVPILFGINTFEVVATDIAGNITKKEFELTNFKRTTIIMKIDSVEFLVNGEAKELRFAPFIKQNSTMVPVRAISEAFGAIVKYDENTRSIEIILGETQILLQIGVSHLIVKGEKTSLSVAPLIRNGSTFVPLRAISEALNSDVDWAPETKEITIERLFIP